MNQSVDDALSLFEKAVKEARLNKEKKKEMGEFFSNLLVAAGKTPNDLILAGIAHRTTCQRWLHGNSIPHPGQMKNLREYLSNKQTTVVEHASLFSILSDYRCQPVIRFFLDKKLSGNDLDENQLKVLLEIASKSKGELSVAFMQTILGLGGDED